MLALLFLLLAGDWPQFLGPGRDGVYEGPPLSTEWSQGRPVPLWKIDVGQGLAGPAVVGDRLVLFHRLGASEVVDVLDRATGARLWRHEYPTTYRDDFGFDEGPRAVPVVVDGVVYTFGAQGVLSAVRLEAGELLWRVDTAERFDVRKGFFGAAGSPLVEDGRVLLNPGGEEGGLAAFDAKTGKLLWSATTDEASYSSPTAATLAGRRLALFFTRAGLVAVDPKDGEVVHRRDWRSRSRSSVNAAVPLVVDDVVFVSASYGTGAIALEARGSTLEPLWSSDDAMSNHYATSVAREGVLYGFHGRQEYSPSLRAVELRTGRVLWSEERFGAGTLTLAGDTLVIVRETGEFVVAAASAESFEMLGRAPLLSGTIRAYPALAHGVLYVRNESTLAAFDLTSP